MYLTKIIQKLNIFFFRTQNNVLILFYTTVMKSKFDNNNNNNSTVGVPGVWFFVEMSVFFCLVAFSRGVVCLVDYCRVTVKGRGDIFL